MYGKIRATKLKTLKKERDIIMRAPIKVPFIREKRFNKIIFKPKDNFEVIISSPKAIEDKLKKLNLKEIGECIFDLYNVGADEEKMDERLKKDHLSGFESVHVYLREYKRPFPCTAITVMVR